MAKNIAEIIQDANVAVAFLFRINFMTRCWNNKVSINGAIKTAIKKPSIIDACTGPAVCDGKRMTEKISVTIISMPIVYNMSIVVFCLPNLVIKLL